MQTKIQLVNSCVEKLDKETIEFWDAQESSL